MTFSNSLRGIKSFDASSLLPNDGVKQLNCKASIAESEDT